MQVTKFLTLSILSIFTLILISSVPAYSMNWANLKGVKVGVDVNKEVIIFKNTNNYPVTTKVWIDNYAASGGNRILPAHPFKDACDTSRSYSVVLDSNETKRISHEACPSGLMTESLWKWRISDVSIKPKIGTSSSPTTKPISSSDVNNFVNNKQLPGPHQKGLAKRSTIVGRAQVEFKVENVSQHVFTSGLLVDVVLRFPEKSNIDDVIRQTLTDNSGYFIIQNVTSKIESAAVKSIYINGNKIDMANGAIGVPVEIEDANVLLFNTGYYIKILDKKAAGRIDGTLTIRPTWSGEAIDILRYYKDKVNDPIEKQVFEQSIAKNLVLKADNEREQEATDLVKAADDLYGDKQYKQAIVNAQKSIKKKKFSIWPYRILVKSFYELKNYPSAYSYFVEGMEVKPRLIEELNEKVVREILEKAGHGNEFILYARKYAHSLHKKEYGYTSKSGRYLLYKELIQQNKANEAIAEAQYFPNFSSYLALSDALDEKGYYQEATKTLHKAIAFIPKEIEIINGLDLSNYDKTGKKEAISKKSTIKNTDKKIREVKLHLAETLLKEKKYESSLPVLSSIIQEAKERQLNMALFYKGNSLIALKRFQEGLDTLLRIELNSLSKYSKPHGGRVANTIAWMLATCPDQAVRNGTMAIEYAKKSISYYEKEYPSILDTLAAAYAENGDFTLATATQSKAIDILIKNKAKENVIASFSERLNLYNSGKSFIEKQ